jgi:zinc/manganese transport system substrate-binding protein
MLVRRLLLVLLGLAVLAAGCRPVAQPVDRELLVVATTTILGDIVQNVVGDDGRVETLIPRGADPHEFQASADQALLLRKARLVVANGLELEEGLLDVLRAAREEGVEVLEVGPLVDPLPLKGGAGGGQLDPHVWLDPVRMVSAVELIGERLALADDRLPDDRWQARAAAHQERLLEVHGEIEAQVAQLPIERRKLVTSHDAFGYFAARYGFEVVGVVIPGGGTASAPSAAELAALAKVIRERQVPAIFTEETMPQNVARALAQEVGRAVQLVQLYSGSLGAPGSGAETYLGLLRTDARLIVEALR